MPESMKIQCFLCRIDVYKHCQNIADAVTAYSLYDEYVIYLIPFDAFTKVDNHVDHKTMALFG